MKKNSVSYPNCRYIFCAGLPGGRGDGRFSENRPYEKKFGLEKFPAVIGCQRPRMCQKGTILAVQIKLFINPTTVITIVKVQYRGEDLTFY